MQVSEIDDMRLSRLAGWFNKPIVEPEEIVALAQAEIDHRSQCAPTTGTLTDDRAKLEKALYKWGFTNGVNKVCNCCGRLPHKEGCELYAVLSRRTAEPQPAAEPSPAPVDAPSGDVIVDHMNSAYRKAQNGAPGGYQMCAAYNVARAHMLEHPPSEWLDAVEKAVGAYLLDEHGWNVGDALFAVSKLRARLKPSEKTPEERVTVVGAVVFLDGKEYACFRGHDSHGPAERYAAGLRVELKGAGE